MRIGIKQYTPNGIFSANARIREFLEYRLSTNQTGT